MKYTKYVSCSLLVMMLIMLSGTAIQAQDSTQKSDFEGLQEHLQRDYFTVNALLQAVGDYQYERVSGNNGFMVGSARMQVTGVLDNRFGYQLQASFLRSPSILDANVFYNMTSNLSVKAGLFIAPFSYEFLTSAAAIDFVNRSSVVNQLAPKRQIGMQLQGTLAEGKFKYSAGMFNGNGFGTNANDDDKFLYTARLEANSGIGEGSGDQFVMGLNASYEESDNPASGAGLLSNEVGDQLLLGADSRITYNSMMLAGEFMYSTINTEVGMEYNPFGYHITSGYFVTPKTQLLARWDYFDGDFISTSAESIIGGINIFPSEVSELQLNYIYPIEEGADFAQILLNLQIAF